MSKIIQNFTMKLYPKAYKTILFAIIYTLSCISCSKDESTPEDTLPDFSEERAPVEICGTVAQAIQYDDKTVYLIRTDSILYYYESKEVKPLGEKWCIMW
jgi:hypothetical protein